MRPSEANHGVGIGVLSRLLEVIGGRLFCRGGRSALLELVVLGASSLRGFSSITSGFRPTRLVLPFGSVQQLGSMFKPYEGSRSRRRGARQASA